MRDALLAPIAERREAQDSIHHAQGAHYEQDIVFDSRADAGADYSRVRSREPAFATTLAEGAIGSGMQIEM